MPFLLFLLILFLPFDALACAISGSYGAPRLLTAEKMYLICRDGYEIVWSPRTRNPVYVQQIISRGVTNGKAPRSEFREEPLLPPHIRTSLNDYRNATMNGESLSRGHMAPADDYSGNARMKDETFYLSNVVPQVQRCNNSGVWRSIEGLVREWAQAGPVMVITGPSGSLGAINGVNVPSHLWKVAHDMTRNVTTAWLVPNAPLCGTKPSQFVVDLSVIERQSGLSLTGGKNEDRNYQRGGTQPRIGHPYFPR